MLIPRLILMILLAGLFTTIVVGGDKNIQRQEVDVTIWDKSPPKKSNNCGNEIPGVVTAIDNISMTMLPTPSFGTYTNPDGSVTPKSENPLIVHFGHKPIRLYFVGQLREDKAAAFSPLWQSGPSPLMYQMPNGGDYFSSYRPGDTKVGDHVMIGGVGIYDDTIPIMGTIKIVRRPGGLIPPASAWKEKRHPLEAQYPAYHERMNLMHEHEAKGLPDPTNDDLIRRYMPQAWAKQQREKQLESIPYIKD